MSKRQFAVFSAAAFVVADIWLFFFTPRPLILFGCAFVGMFVVALAPGTNSPSALVKTLGYLASFAGLVTVAALIILMLSPLLRMFINPKFLYKNILNPLSP